ncbi:glycosyl transferase family 39 [Candidatus Moduliflexus flocculans]|uniref:Glycosyl transferase family 39 n=1 Tax=Candidatus Moduliflexus flocculans TaxID=1499966 RepID=A0A0S6VVM4_9BACT|nr:glycosyl transferase family 39 [Candidatus Moduliflexus flocculans]
MNDLEANHWNPKFFAYGSLPIYLLKIVQMAADAILARLNRPPADFFMLGRAISALFGSLTLLLLYRFGKRFFSERVGILSSALLGVTVLHIQLSHFLTVDVMLTFFVVLAVYYAAQLTESPAKFSYSLLCGAIIGLALATKVSAAPLFGVLGVAHLLVMAREIREHRSAWKTLLRHAGIFLAAALLAGVVFAACEPYALLDYQEFARQIKEQNDMALGKSQPPYVIQYEGTSAYWYPLQQLVRYGMGLPLGLLTLFGVVAVSLWTLSWIGTSILAEKREHSPLKHPQAALLALAWFAPVFIIVGGFKVKFLRYLVPLTPFLCLFGAIWIDSLLQKARLWKWATIAAFVGIFVYSAWYAVAFTAIYGRDDPRIQASRAIYANIPHGSTILTELWEFTSLVPVDGGNPGDYRLESVDIYPSDGTEKIWTIAEQLSRADVIFLATKRLYGSILRVPDRYPLTIKYYQLLFDGQLGFEPIAPLTNYPSLFGKTFNDDFADESFSVYEHPKTILFQKVREMTQNELAALIINAPLVQNPEMLRKRLLAFPRDENDERQLAQPRLPAQGALSRLSEGTPSFQWMAVLIWWGTVELLSIIAFPLTCLIFGNLTDKGYAAAKVCGLLFPAYLVWISTNLDLTRFAQATLWSAVAWLAALSLSALLLFRRRLSAILKSRWKTFAMYELIFFASYAGFIAFRAYNPDIFWSESSMDFSILNALVRSETLPPHDPWISGFPLNYYYVGHYFVAALTKLTGIAPQITYNLAFAIFPALAILQVFALMYNLTRRYAAALTGSVFACILGNLDGFFLLRDWLTSKEPYYRYFRCAHEIVSYSVHEFPFWSFIFLDLHAHLLNLPFVLITLQIGLNWLFWKSTPRTSAATLLQLAAYALIIGTLAVISSWDYPTGVIFLMLIALLHLWRHRVRLREQWREALTPLAQIVLMIPASFCFYLPFYQTFSRKGMGIGLVGNLTTPFPAFWTIFGLFLLITLSWYVWQAVRTRSMRTGVTLMALITVGVLTGVIASGGFQFKATTLIFTIGVTLFSAVALAHRFDHHRADAFAWLCCAYACVIVAGCDLIFIRDFLEGGEWKRMNTIFKFYFPAWILFSIAAAYGLARMVAGFKRLKRTASHSSAAYSGYVIWLACIGVYVALCAIFPVMTVYTKRHGVDVYQRRWLPPTLDGLAYLKATNSNEYEAIRWLNANVAGTPTIVEAVNNDYLYEYARISANTGLPAILGWPSHVDQREHWQRTGLRREDVTEIYSSADIGRVRDLLRFYHAQYIIVGTIERRDFTPEMLKKFEDFPEYFTPVFRAGGTVIYFVQQ